MIIRKYDGRPDAFKGLVDFEANKFDGDVGALSAYITTYKNEDVVGDIMLPGVLDKYIENFSKEEGNKLPMLWQHDQNELIGEWTSFETNTRGVKGNGTIYDETSRGNDVRKFIKRGMVNSVSIGFIAKDYELREDGKGFIFKEIELFETSVVISPANPRAKIISAKRSDGSIDLKQVSKALRNSGLSRKETNVVLSSCRDNLNTVSKQENKTNDFLRNVNLKLRSN